MIGESRQLGVLLIVLLLDLLAFTLILPLFPSILDHFSQQQQHSSDPIFSKLAQFSEYLQSLLGVPSLDRYNNVFFGGILGSLFSFLQFISSPLFGALSDHHGRKPLLLLAVFGSTISYLLWSLSGPCFSLFFLSRLIGGLSKASVSLSIAIVTDILPEQRRGKGMAMVGVAFSLGFLLGPSIGAYFSICARLYNKFDPWPARLAIALSLLEMALIAVWMPETLATMKEEGKEHSPSSSSSSSFGIHHFWSLINPKALFSFDFINERGGEVHHHHPHPLDSPTTSNASQCSIRHLREYSLVYFLFLLFFSAMEFTLGFLTHIRFNYSSANQGRLYLFSGLSMLIIQGFFVRRLPSTPLAQSMGALVGLCIIIPAFLLISIAHSQFLLFSGLFLYSIASATVVPALTTLFAQHSHHSQKGLCLGAFRSIGSLARAIGPLLGSFLFWLFGPTLSYAIGAIGLVIPVLLFRRICAETNGRKDEDDGIKKSK